MRPLSGGASSVVLDAGEQVVRIGIGPLVDRPRIPEMLQVRAAGTVVGLHYEVLPKANTRDITQADVDLMSNQLSERGYAWGDAAKDNLGRHEGRLVVIDPGGLTPLQHSRIDSTVLDRERGAASSEVSVRGSTDGSKRQESIQELVAANRFEPEKGAVVPERDIQPERELTVDKGRGQGISR